MKVLSTFMLSLLLLSTSALAVDATGNYAVWGVGKKACFGYNKEAGNPDGDKYKHYIRGFLTAYNIFTEKTYNISGKMDENQIVEWLHAYCDDNPMSSFENALTSFTFDHYDKRMKSSGRGAGR